MLKKPQKSNAVSDQQQQQQNVPPDQNSWLVNQLHVLTTLDRLDETFSKLEDQIKQIEQRQNKDMSEFREEMYEIKSKMEKELGDVKMQLKVEELARLTEKLESAKEEGAWEEKVESHIERRTKVNWIVVSAAIGSVFAVINLLIKYIFSLLGI